MEFLSDKRTILSNPGEKRNNLYYNVQNTTVSEVEVGYNLGRFRQSLSSSRFNSVSQVIIPNQSFLGDCFLSLELPATVADQTICRGWGYSCIRNISYLAGSSNVSLMSINGQSAFQQIMLQCETEEKKSEYLRLGGQVILTAGVIPKAVIQLPLPWSTACSVDGGKKLIDTNLLNQPITIQIEFDTSAKIYGGNGARPDQFTRVECITRQGDLSNKALSLRNTLMANEKLMLGYPFIHSQSYAPPRFTVVNPNDVTSITLQSFINADIVGISIGVIADTSLNPTGNNSPSPLNYVDLTDVRLLFNGQTVYDCPGDLMKLANAKYSKAGSGFVLNDVIQNGAIAPFTSNPVDTYIYCFDMAVIRSLCFDKEYQNTPRLPSQVLELEFKVPAADTYTCYATYYYNGIMEISQGQSNIYFN
jgi:hypothetical protein